ncbi:MAG: hypothetical protein MJZ38_06030 [archaeon]|nr:hypothetical protein [archaeon]
MNTPRFVMVRLKDTVQDDYRRGKELISTFKCLNTPSQDYFLRYKALDFERRGVANTYLLVDSRTDRTVGFFTVNAGTRCAYDKPVFEISHLCVGDDCLPFNETRLIRAAVEMFDKCAERIGPMVLTARCGLHQLESYEKEGFDYLGQSIGRFHRVVRYY